MKMFLSHVINETKKIIRRELNYYRIRPTYALLFMTYRCTGRCSMCVMWQKDANIKEEMTLEEWKNIIDSLHNMSICHVEFFGGDALLRKNVLISLIKYAHNIGIFTELPTNSNLLTRDLAVDLVNSGLDVIWISLDGIEKTHDKMRGKSGAFLKVHNAIEGIKSAKGKGNKPRIYINCVVTRHNLDSFDKVISYAQDMGINGIDFEYVGEITLESVSKTLFDGQTPTPFFKPTGSSALLDMEGATLLKKKISEIKKLLRKNGLRVNTGKIDILSKEDIVSGRFPNKRCYICRDWVTIDPYGNVIGCLHFNNYILGNAKENNLMSIWKGSKHIEFIRARDEGRFAICNRCSNGAIRNNTAFQSLQSVYYEAMKTGKE